MVNQIRLGPFYGGLYEFFTPFGVNELLIAFKSQFCNTGCNW